MFLTREGMPDEDELVMCTVTKVQFHSVFVTLDEFKKSGMIHISEVSPGRIRNIRDFVKEGKKVVCKVLRIHRDKGHIDLSLRRVTEGQRRNKVNELKQQQKAEKIVEYVAKNQKLDTKKLFFDILKHVGDEHGNVYNYFQAIVEGTATIEDMKQDSKITKAIEEVSKKTGKDKNYIKELVKKDLEEIIRRSIYKSPITSILGPKSKMNTPIGKIFTMGSNVGGKYE